MFSYLENAIINMIKKSLAGAFLGAALLFVTYPIWFFLANLRMFFIFGLFIFNFWYLAHGVSDNVALANTNRELGSFVVISLAIVLAELDRIHGKIDNLKEDKVKK